MAGRLAAVQSNPLSQYRKEKRNFRGVSIAKAAGGASRNAKGVPGGLYRGECRKDFDSRRVRGRIRKYDFESPAFEERKTGKPEKRQKWG